MSSYLFPSNSFPCERDLVELNSHKGATVWLTGLSGAGKTTIAIAASKALYNLNVRTFVLDGDNIRLGLNQDLGFSLKDRSENIRRVAEVAKLMTSAGLINIVSFISPLNKDRALARSLQPNSFIEVFVDCPLLECQRRDPKGLYIKAKSGIIKDFTGINSPYENPSNPDLYLNTDKQSVNPCVSRIIRILHSKGFIFSKFTGFYD